MKNKKSSGVLSKILILLGIVVVVFLGGYFFLDKIIVPKHFGEYGIYGMSDLVGVMSSLYKNPKEEKLITNGWSESDYNSASKKLDNAGYNIDDGGDIVLENFRLNASSVELTDREFAAVCNRLIDKGYLNSLLPNLEFANLEDNISILELNISPNESSKVGDEYMSANINFIVKLQTVNLIDQIETLMGTPKSLLKMIIPDVLYFTVSYDFDLSKTGSERLTNGSIAINGRTAEQSKILINLLITFIFSPEDNMDMEKFTESFGNIILESIDELGDFKFKKVDDRNGFFISAV